MMAASLVNYYSFVFWGLGVAGFCGLALVVPVYTSCVLRGALRFL
jgi:hypothetical protein